MKGKPVRSTRWVVKKAARRACMWGSFATGSLAARERFAAAHVRVLTYHRFGNERHDPFAVTPEAFDRQMAWLASEGRAISLADLGAFLGGQGTIRSGSVLVTIDDGFESALTVAAPTLARHAVPAVAFVTTSLVGNAEAGARQPERYLDWPELPELEQAGLVVGSHNHTHRSLAKLPAAEILDEARRSRGLLGDCLGRPIESFAYPFGTRADFNEATARALLESGYDFGFTSRHGVVAADSRAIELPRVKVEGGEDLDLFRLLCRGGMDAWQVVDDVLFRLQQSRNEQEVAAGP